MLIVRTAGRHFNGGGLARGPRAGRPRWRATRRLLSCGAALLATPVALAAPACALQPAGLTVEVASAGADDEWDPTLEVVVSGPSGPLSRLLVSDARPIEACWWQDLDGDGVPELAIGLGPTEATASGVLVYAWRDGRLDPRKVPTLRGHDGAYRYVVQGTRLYAFPVAGRQAGPPVARATYVFDFARGHWESDQPPSRASGP